MTRLKSANYPVTPTPTPPRPHPQASISASLPAALPQTSQGGASSGVAPTGAVVPAQNKQKRMTKVADMLVTGALIFCLLVVVAVWVFYW